MLKVNMNYQFSKLNVYTRFLAMWQCKFSVYVFQYKNNELEDEWF